MAAEAWSLCLKPPKIWLQSLLPNQKQSENHYILGTWTRKYRAQSLTQGSVTSSQHKNTQNISAELCGTNLHYKMNEKRKILKDWKGKSSFHGTKRV